MSLVSIFVNCSQAQIDWNKRITAIREHLEKEYKLPSLLLSADINPAMKCAQMFSETLPKTVPLLFKTSLNTCASVSRWVQSDAYVSSSKGRLIVDDVKLYDTDIITSDDFASTEIHELSSVDRIITCFTDQASIVASAIYLTGEVPQYTAPGQALYIEYDKEDWADISKESIARLEVI